MSDFHPMCKCGHGQYYHVKPVGGNHHFHCTVDGCDCAAFNLQIPVAEAPKPKCQCGHTSTTHNEEGRCLEEGCDCRRFYVPALYFPPSYAPRNSPTDLNLTTKDLAIPDIRSFPASAYDGIKVDHMWIDEFTQYEMPGIDILHGSPECQNFAPPVVTKLGVATTVGEVRKLLEAYPDDMSFGFRGQPMQPLYEVRYPRATYVVFQPEP